MLIENWVAKIKMTFLDQYRDSLEDKCYNYFHTNLKIFDI